MGNAAPRAQPPSQLDNSSQYRTYLMDYSPHNVNIVFGNLIGDGKFLKSIYCKCEEGGIVVKLYRKYDPNESLAHAEQSLKKLTMAFTIETQPNLLPYADYQLSQKHQVAFLVRQYFAANLYDRLCSRPFLTKMEKKWIAFQLLRALDQMHQKGICHGDIKQENILVTSWNWIFVTDFAPFKPTYLPEDDPADYNYYFCAIDATRRSCCVAPERFYGANGTTVGAVPSGAGNASGSTPGGGSGGSGAGGANGATGSGITLVKGTDAMMLSRLADSEISVEEVEKQLLTMNQQGNATKATTNSEMPGTIPFTNASGASIPAMSLGMGPAGLSTGGGSSTNVSSGFSSARTRREGYLLPSMDVFSVGCVIAEMFLGGKPFFDLPSLLKYRTGDMAMLTPLTKIEDPAIEKLLAHMLQLDPRARFSASEYLSRNTGLRGIFPAYFDSFLFRFFTVILSKNGKIPDARIRVVCKYYGRLLRELVAVEDIEGEEFFQHRLKEGHSSEKTNYVDNVAQRIYEEIEAKIPSEKRIRSSSEMPTASNQRTSKSSTSNARPTTRSTSGYRRQSSTEGVSQAGSTTPGNTAATSSPSFDGGTSSFSSMSSGGRRWSTSSERSPRKAIDSLSDQYKAFTARKQAVLSGEAAVDSSDSPSLKRPSVSPIGQDDEDEDDLVEAKRASLEAAWANENNGIMIILSLICSSLRHVYVPQSKVTAIHLIRHLGQFASDEARLQRLVPFLLEVVDDPNANVRAVAIRSITALLSLVKSFPLSDASIFAQYIFPAMSSLPSDADEMVRIAFAESLPRLAETSRRFLEIAQALKQRNSALSTTNSSSSTSTPTSNPASKKGKSSSSASDGSAANSFDKELNRLHRLVARLVIQLAAPDQKSSSSLVKRALLHDITRLCVFFGRERTLDVVLPQLITFLNERDWEVRGAFFDCIVGVCSFVGRVTVELYILPCIEQALIDDQEIVITKAVHCLSLLCEIGLFQRNALLDKAKMVASLLLHPSWWIREAVLQLMTHIASQLGSVEATVFLVPVLRPFMNKKLAFYGTQGTNEEYLTVLKNCVRPHVSREAFDAALIAFSNPELMDDNGTPNMDMLAESYVALQNADSKSQAEDQPEVGRHRGARDPLSSVDSLDTYAGVRGFSPPSGPADGPDGEGKVSQHQFRDSSQEVEAKKNEVQGLQLMKQYIEIASRQMKCKMELAHSEQVARMQSSSLAARPGGNSMITSPTTRQTTSSAVFAKALSRAQLYTIRVPDMRFALGMSASAPLKASDFGNIPSRAAQAAAGSIPSGSFSVKSDSILLPVSKSSSLSRPTQQFQTGGNTGMVTRAVGSNLSLLGRSSNLTSHKLSSSDVWESIPTHLISKIFGLRSGNGPGAFYAVGMNFGATQGNDETSSMFSTNALAASGNGGAMLYDNSGGAFAANSMVYNLNTRDIFSEAAANFQDPSMLAMPKRPIKRPHSATSPHAHHHHHHPAGGRDASFDDPALRYPRKLLSRLTALGVPPLPPDLGPLRSPLDSSVYSIYATPSSPLAANVTISVQGGMATPPSALALGTTPNMGMLPPTIVSTASLSTGGTNGYSYMAPVMNATSGQPSPMGASGANTAAGFTMSTIPSTYRNWKPRKNMLVAELGEHEAAVHRLGCAQDYSFLASGSHDGTIKLWSVRAFQHSVNQESKCTYDGQGGVLTDMRVLDNCHSIASSSTNGSVHVFRVDRISASNGNFSTTGLKEIRCEADSVTSLDHFNNQTESLLVYATRDGFIHAWDLRMRREAWCVQVSPELGSVTCMTHSLDGSSWFAVGTTRGFICLYDLRFQLLVRIWRHSSLRSILRLKPCMGLPNTRPSGGSTNAEELISLPLVFVAADDGDVAVFDLTIGACRASFRTVHLDAPEQETTKCPTLLHIPIPPRNRKVLGNLLGLDGISSALEEMALVSPSDQCSVRAILSTSAQMRGVNDALITAGEDKQIRYWDLKNGKLSFTICGDGESKLFYDNQKAKSDWWRIHPTFAMPSSISASRSQLMGSSEIVATPASVNATISKAEIAWSKMSPPILTICQDSSKTSVSASATTPSSAPGSQTFGAGDSFNASASGGAAAGGGTSSFRSTSSAASTNGADAAAILNEKRGLVPPSPGHNDCILDLCLVDLNGPMLASSGRDGVIKVWK